MKVLVFLVALAAAPPVFAQAPARIDVPYTQFTLPNGLHVILHEDHSVPLVNLELLHRSLGSPWIETGILERSWHVITMDVDRAEVGRLAADFLERVEAAPAAVRAPA